MRSKGESYVDMMSRLFNGKLVKSVTFAVTDACSLRCTYCYQKEKGNHSMSFETAKKMVDLLLDGKASITPENSSGIILDFIGGEPLLEIRLISDICDYFVEQMILRQHPWATRFMFSICTNGVAYFDPEVQKYLRRYAGRVSLSITVDGDKELHDSCRVFPDGSGSYDRAMAAVEHYRDVLGGFVGSKMTICPENIRYTARAVQSILENGYRVLNLNCVYEEGWTPEHAAILYHELKAIADFIFERKLLDEVHLSIFSEIFFRPKKEDDLENWCGGTGKMLAVDYTGAIYPCVRYMPNSLCGEAEPYVIGHVDTGMLCNCEQCERMELLKRIDRRTQSTDECFYCPIAAGCSWCSAYNYQKFGTPDRRATFICEMHKARALANLYFWNRKYILSGSSQRMENHVPREWAVPIVGEDEYQMLLQLSET